MTATKQKENKFRINLKPKIKLQKVKKEEKSEKISDSFQIEAERLILPLCFSRVELLPEDHPYFCQ